MYEKRRVGLFIMKCQVANISPYVARLMVASVQQMVGYDKVRTRNCLYTVKITQREIIFAFDCADTLIYFPLIKIMIELNENFMGRGVRSTGKWDALGTQQAWIFQDFVLRVS